MGNCTADERTKYENNVIAAVPELVVKTEAMNKYSADAQKSWSNYSKQTTTTQKVTPVPSGEQPQ